MNRAEANQIRAEQAATANGALARYVLAAEDVEFRGRELEIARARAGQPGATWGQIAASLGMTKNAVASAWHRLCVRNSLGA